MFPSLSIRFFLRAQYAKGARFPIYVRITAFRKKAEIATKYRIPLKEWDEDKQRTKRNAVINEHLAELENQVYETAKHLQRTGKTVNAATLRDFLTQKERVSPGMLGFYEDFLERLVKAGEVIPETVRSYRTTKNILTQFLKDQGRDENISLTSIDYKFISDLDVYLLNQTAGNYAKTLERNTVNKHHSRLRTVLIRAMREGYLTRNPYREFKLKQVPSNRTYLTNEELQKIIVHKLGDNESLKRVRDIFLFSVYTGLRFEDAQNLSIEQINIDAKNEWSIIIVQEKTKERVHIPLLPPAVKIIQKYENTENKITGKILPKISNQKVNSYLKVIADLTGLKKTLTHHVARHTCATTILLTNEVPMETVSKWLGHTNIKTTQIYAKITNNMLKESAKKVAGRI